MSKAEGSKYYQDEKLSTRHRSPSFSKVEIKTILDLVEKYKSIIQNRSTTSAVNQLKESTWEKISKAFNKHGFENVRSAECLKTKWENLKRTAKKSTNSLLDRECTESDDVIRQIVSIMAHTEDNSDINEKLSESEEEIIEQVEENSVNDLFEPWELSNDKESDNSDGENEQKRRMRGRSFKQEEVKALLDLIEKYKSIILNRSNSTMVNQTKEAAWRKISKEYNKHAFKNIRSVECLKMKWENLKREAKKLAKNECYEGLDDVISHTVTLMTQMKDDPVMNEKISDTDEEINEQEENLNGDHLIKQWEHNKEKVSDDSDEENKNERRMNRSANFSPRECTLLLDCVKRERSNLFLKPNTAGAIRIKNRAWFRITNAYNRLSPQKRTTKVLRDKFINMKKMTKGINFRNYFRNKHSKLAEEDTPKTIKPEPTFDYKEESDVENDKTDDDQSLFDNKNDDQQIGFADDPLSTVLSSDSGVACMNSSEDQKVTKLKEELLNYKMETAKLQRKRVEDLIKDDNAYREAKQIETALRIRAARLEATAAAMKLPPLHPALQFTPEEASGQDYLSRYHYQL